MRPSSPNLDLVSGLVIEERYELIREVASGAMGTVWLAERQGLGGQVAIKFTHYLDRDARERFFREAQVVAQLSSAHVVRVFELGSYQEQPFLVMEYLAGETLRELLLAMGRLTPQEVLPIIEQVASAIEEASQAGVIHRDLKPANIFLTGSPTSPVVKVLDFGVARTDGSGMTGEGEVIGTPSYLSPEQALDSRRVDVRTDLWSLAIIAFECLTGDLPFRADTGPQLIEAILEQAPARPSHIAEVPPAFDAWFWRATEKDPAARFPTVSEFVAELRAALDEVAPPLRGSTTDTLKSGTIPQAMTIQTPEKKSSKGTILVAFLAAIVGLGVLVVPFVGGGEPDSEPSEPTLGARSQEDRQALVVGSASRKKTSGDGSDKEVKPSVAKEVPPAPTVATSGSKKVKSPSSPVRALPAVSPARATPRRAEPPPNKHPVTPAPQAPAPPAAASTPDEPKEPKEPAPPTSAGAEEDLWGKRL